MFGRIEILDRTLAELAHRVPMHRGEGRINRQDSTAIRAADPDPLGGVLEDRTPQRLWVSARGWVLGGGLRRQGWVLCRTVGWPATDAFNLVNSVWKQGASVLGQIARL